MSLNLDDIRLMEQIVRVCQQRGAILAPEMVDVGNLYKKLVEIIEKVSKGGNTGNGVVQNMPNMSNMPNMPNMPTQAPVPSMPTPAPTQNAVRMPTVEYNNPQQTGNTYNLAKFNISSLMGGDDEKKAN